MPKDELGIEYPAEIEESLKDPKVSSLFAVMDYRERRKAKEKEIEDAKKPPAPKEKLFGIF